LEHFLLVYGKTAVFSPLASKFFVIISVSKRYLQPQKEQIMGFLKKLFGGGDDKKEYVDKQGVYFYVQCNNCGKVTRLRADKQYDLSNDGDGYTWHKTIVDNKCFRPMNTVVTLDKNYNVVNADIDGGRYLTEEEFNAIEKEEVVQRELARREAEESEADNTEAGD
jgi:hypothetical protein